MALETLLDLVKHAIRTRPDLNQKVVASRLGIATSHMSQILSGEHRLHCDRFLEMLEICGLSMRNIVEDHPDLFADIPDDYSRIARRTRQLHMQRPERLEYLAGVLDTLLQFE